jgi:hypothetical protein
VRHPLPPVYTPQLESREPLLAVSEVVLGFPSKQLGRNPRWFVAAAFGFWSCACRWWLVPCRLPLAGLAAPAALVLPAGVPAGNPGAWGRMGLGPHGVRGCMGHGAVSGAAPGRMGPGTGIWHHGSRGPSKVQKTNNKLARGRKKKKARGRLLFAALALGQQPTGTAIKAPHPC